MKNNHDPIKQENKKAMPKFIVLLVVSMLAGLAGGKAMTFLYRGDFGDILATAGRFFSTKVAVWLLIALPVVELAVCLPVYFGAKKRLAAWDGEDETVSNEIEAKLSACIGITSLAFVLAFFLVAAMVSDFTNIVGTEWDMGPVMFFSGLAAFAVCLAVTIVFQQRLVDTAKKMNPEKHGSVYDTKFQKKWMDSCDEAERAIIGQCAYKAYQAVTYTCLILWAVLAVGGMFFGWGFLPAMAVCVIWGVSQSVYFYWSIKLSKPGQTL